MHIIPFSEIHDADLQVDAIYQGKRKGNAADDPLPHLLKVSNSGGFRYRGSLDALELVVLTSTLKNPDWPDMLDLETGVYTYYGDNKKPGRLLHETPRRGNELLKRIFNLAHSGTKGRRQVPPVLVFANTGEWRDVIFLGLAVPGTSDLRVSEDLVAVWRISKEGKRFENYRARFSVLKTSVLKREWITDVINGNPHSPNAPSHWINWVETGQIHPLLAMRSLKYRTKAEQLPQTSGDKNILEYLRRYFASDHHGFEPCAAALARLLLPNIATIDLTRPSRDGGRDAVGQFRIGSGVAGILVDFALEAKCYSTNNGVGVKDMSRLISRLRHRQFGILVTTSYVNTQAYREIREDQHPVIIVAGTDIIELLRKNGYANPVVLRSWLEQNFADSGKLNNSQSQSIKHNNKTGS